MATLLPWRELTDAERDEFLTENNTGILSFAREEPYAIPMGCMYTKGTVILGFADGGTKLDCIQRSPKVCYVVCRPRRYTPDLKEACTTVIFEGELEKVTDMAYYGLDKIPDIPEDLHVFRIKVKKVTTRKCMQQPCMLLARREVSK